MEVEPGRNIPASAALRDESESRGLLEFPPSVPRYSTLKCTLLVLF